MKDSKPASSRTWKTTTRVTVEGALIATVTHTVTLIKTASGIRAMVDGQRAELVRALDILKNAAQTEVVAETLVIGRKPAHQLHKRLGRMQVRDHYAYTGGILGRPVFSLAVLTTDEEARVWAYINGERVA